MKQKAKIDDNGSLHIERHGKMESQNCPFCSFKEWISCGDWCPQFGEQLETSFCDTSEKLKYKKCISICQNKVLYFDEIKDER